MKALDNNLGQVAYRVGGVAVALALWELLANVKNDPAIVSVERIASAAKNVVFSSEFAQNATSTIRILAIGVFLAVLVGVTTAVVAVYNEKIWYAIEPTVELCRNIPSITLFPILLVMYGVGDPARIFVILWTSLPPILLSSIRGISSVDRGQIEAGYALGMSKAQVMRLIMVPFAMPSIINGIRIGTGSGFVAIVVAEMLGATSGIGFMVLWTTNSFRYPETYVYILIIGLMGMAVNYFMERAEKSVERKCS